MTQSRSSPKAEEIVDQQAVSPMPSPMPPSALSQQVMSTHHRRVATETRFEDHLLPVDTAVHANVEDEAETLILAALEQRHANEPPLAEEEKQVFGLFRSEVPVNVFGANNAADIPTGINHVQKVSENVASSPSLPHAPTPQAPPEMPPISRQLTSPRESPSVYTDGVGTGKPSRHNRDFSISEMSAVLHAKNRFKHGLLSKQHRAQVPSLSSRDTVNLVATKDKAPFTDAQNAYEHIEPIPKDQNQANSSAHMDDIEKGSSGLVNRAHKRINTQYTIGDVSKALPSSPEREQSSKHVDFDLSGDKSHTSRSGFDAIDMTHFDSRGLGILDEDAANKHDGGKMNDSVVQRMRKRRLSVLDVIRPAVMLEKIKRFMHIFVVVMLPILGIAVVLYYFCGNPLFWFDASLSWWFIFLVRQMLTWYLAQATEYLVVRCLVMRTQLCVRWAGPLITLCFIQSRGWPFVLSSWAIWDLLLLYGGGNEAKENFAEHWLYEQNVLGIFNDENDGNDVVKGTFYLNILISGIVVGVLTSLKRTSTALYFGRKTYDQYKESLEKLLRKMILLSELAELAEAIEDELGFDNEKHSSFLHGMLNRRPSSTNLLSQISTDFDILPNKKGAEVKELSNDVTTATANHSSGLPPLPPKSNVSSEQRFSSSMWTRYRADTGASSKFDINETINKPPQTRGKAYSNTSDITMDVDELTDKESPIILDRRNNLRRDRTRFEGSPLTFLDKWDDPKIVGHDENDLRPPIRDVLEFRKAARHLEDPFPFSLAFGQANTRENCVQSALRVYEKLRLKTPSEALLPADTIGLLATTDHGSIDEEKARRLVRLFRADQSGYINKVSFAQSIDTVYKKKRLLLAALKNSQRLDYVLENIFNVIYFMIMFFVVITLLGFDPMAVVLSFTTIFLSFTFAFGGAASKYTEGIISIVIRRPFEVGDRIAISDPFKDSDPFGSPGWYVEDLNIFFTTVRYAATNEVSTISNYSLANARIVNCARSYNARILFPIKVGIATPRKLLDVLKSTIEQFIHDRPSKWTELEAFRTSAIEPDLGYIQFTLSLLHEKAWQESGVLLDDKAELATFCLETAKKLGIKYESPPLPVNVNIPTVTQDTAQSSVDSSPNRGAASLAAAFAAGAFRSKAS